MRYCVLTLFVLVATGCVKQGESQDVLSKESAQQGEERPTLDILRKQSARRLLSDMLADERVDQWFDSDHDTALWEKRGEVITEIKRRWSLLGRDAEAKKPRLAYIFMALIREDQRRTTKRNEDYTPFPDLRGMGELELIAEMMTHNEETAEQVLPAMGSKWGLAVRSAAIRTLLVREFGKARPEWKWRFGMSLMFVDLPPETQVQVWAAVQDAYDRALRQQKEGRAVIRQTPYFGEGAENVARATRQYILDSVRRRPSKQGVELILHAVNVEIDVGLKGTAAQALAAQDPADPRVKTAVIGCFGTDVASVNAMLFNFIEKQGWAKDFEKVLQGFVVHYRKSYSERATKLLSDAGIEVRGKREARIPEEALAALESFTHTALCDSSAGVRALAFEEVVQGWGKRDSDDKVPGWWFAGKEGPGRFVSDELDEAWGTAAELGVEPVDFEKELDAACDSLEKGKSQEAEVKLPPGFGSWIYGHPGQQLIRLVHAVRMERTKGVAGLPRSTRLFLLLIENHENARGVEEAIVYEAAWLRFLHCVDSFSDSKDELAELHARALLTLLPYNRPQTDLESWFGDAQRILNERELRKTPAKKLGPGEKEGLAYWIERLPDVVVRQWGQPGGPAFSDDESPVHKSIVAFGVVAIDALIDQLPNDRLVRGVSFWRNFARSRTLHTVGEVSQWMLNEIIEEKLGVSLEGKGYLLITAERREELRSWLHALMKLKGE